MKWLFGNRLVRRLLRKIILPNGAATPSSALQKGEGQEHLIADPGALLLREATISLPTEEEGEHPTGRVHPPAEPTVILPGERGLVPPAGPKVRKHPLVRMQRQRRMSLQPEILRLEMEMEILLQAKHPRQPPRRPIAPMILRDQRAPLPLPAKERRGFQTHHHLATRRRNPTKSFSSTTSWTRTLFQNPANGLLLRRLERWERTTFHPPIFWL
mmetsp:Transcript_6392/g.15020  ORF Transcript_6392/g.15020 Transcript_6392/m.15020 type:complete len:214 (-) Transcript_6392:585-1226(-)